MDNGVLFGCRVIPLRSQGVTGLSPAGRSRTVSTRFVEAPMRKRLSVLSPISQIISSPQHNTHCCSLRKGRTSGRSYSRLLFPAFHAEWNKRVPLSPGAQKERMCQFVRIKAGSVLVAGNDKVRGKDMFFHCQCGLYGVSVCFNQQIFAVFHDAPMFRSEDFPGCPSSERYMSLIWAVLKPSGYRISNSNVAGAGSCISLSMQMPSAVRTRFMPSSIPCLYMADAPSRCPAVLRMLSLTDGLISCIMGNRFKRILLRVYSSCRLVLSVT